MSVLIMTAFSLQEVAVAGPEVSTLFQSQAKPLQAVSIVEVISDPARFQVPFEYTTLKEFYAGTNGKLIIHIQDAHANYSGQMSMAKALDKMMTAYGEYLVLTEGASKDVTLTALKPLAAPADWQIAAKRFLQKSVIAGEEYLNLTSKHPIKIRGVEYRALYDQALATYADLVDKRQEILTYLHRIQASIDRLKAKHYSDALLEYEKKVHGSESGTPDLTVQFDELSKLTTLANIDFADFEESSKLKTLKDTEKNISFEKANAEQEKLLAELSSKGLKDKVEEFLAAAKKTRNLQVSQSVLLEQLMDLAESQGIAVDAFQELTRYRDYLKTFGRLDLEKVMKEVELLEDTVYKNLLATDEARKLRAVDRFVGLLNKAYQIKMSSHDFKTLAANKDDFKTETWEAFLNDQLIQLSYFDDLVPLKSLLEEAAGPLFNFYRLVDERDSAFLQNTGRILEEEKAQVGYLVAGGYHTENLTRLFRQEGYSVIVLTPIVEFETDQKLYEKMLLMPFVLAQREKEKAERKLAKAGMPESSRSTIVQTKVGQDKYAAARLAGALEGSRLSPAVGEAAARLAEQNFGENAVRPEDLTLAQRLRDFDPAARMASRPQPVIGNDGIVQLIVDYGRDAAPFDSLQETAASKAIFEAFKALDASDRARALEFVAEEIQWHNEIIAGGRNELEYGLGNNDAQVLAGVEGQEKIVASLKEVQGMLSLRDIDSLTFATLMRGARIAAYYETATINGIEIKVGFDSGYDAYTLYFPQISTTNDREVSDQLFIISENPNDASEVFKEAKRLADQGLDVYEIYKKAEAYARELPEILPLEETSHYEAAAVVNEIEINVRWDEGYENYVLYFPQIRIRNEKGVPDQLFRISQSPEDARRIFEKAKQLAAQKLDVYEVYKQAEVYAGSLTASEEDLSSDETGSGSKAVRDSSRMAKANERPGSSRVSDMNTWMTNTQPAQAARMASVTDSSEEGAPIVPENLGLEKWNTNKVIESILALQTGTYVLEDIVRAVNEQLKNERNQNFSEAVVLRILNAIAPELTSRNLEVYEADGRYYVSIEPKDLKTLKGDPAAIRKELYGDRRVIFISGPSNLSEDYRGIRQSIEAELAQMDPKTVIAVGTTSVGYGRQVYLAAKARGFTVVSLIPEDNQVWSGKADRHVAAGKTWSDRSYFDAISEFSDEIIAIEGYRGTHRETDAFAKKGKPVREVRSDGLTVRMTREEALKTLNKSYKAQYDSADPKDRDAVLHRQRQAILGVYGLIRDDGTLNHDKFYAEHILTASNGSKQEWWNSNEVISAFVDEVEWRITAQEVSDYAQSIHDNGYWRLIRDAIGIKKAASVDHLVIGRLPVDGLPQEILDEYFTQEGKSLHDGRFASERGYQIKLNHIKPEKWVDFLVNIGGKDRESVQALLYDKKQNLKSDIFPDAIQLYNANFGSFDELLEEAQKYSDPASRIRRIYNNQKSAMASAFTLTRLRRELSFGQMDYATAVIWRYKGHWEGVYAWDGKDLQGRYSSKALKMLEATKQRLIAEGKGRNVARRMAAKAAVQFAQQQSVRYQVSTDYKSDKFNQDRHKDGPVWRAVLERDLELKEGMTDPAQRAMHLIMRRVTNTNNDEFKSALDYIKELEKTVQEKVKKERETPEGRERMSQMALVSHDLSYWPEVRDRIMNRPADPAVGLAPDFELGTPEYDRFTAFLTADGKKAYDNRYSATGYKMTVGQLVPEKREEFFKSYVKETWGLNKDVPTNEKAQVFNANFGPWASEEGWSGRGLMEDKERYADPSARLKTMLTNQEANIVITRMLLSDFFTGMQMSHGMAVLWRYVVGDYLGEKAYEGSAQVRSNYYDPKFDIDRKLDHAMWSNLMIAMARSEGANDGMAIQGIVARATNETAYAFRSTYEPIKRAVDEREAEITQEQLEQLAPIIHDQGFNQPRQNEIKDAQKAFVGTHLNVPNTVDLSAYLNETAAEYWSKKFDAELIDKYQKMDKTQKADLKKYGIERIGIAGYQFNSLMFKSEEAMLEFYAAIGKQAPSDRGSVIFNENAMSFADLQKQPYGVNQPARINKVLQNQKTALATALLLSEMDLDSEKMAYYAAVIWREAGQYDGLDGYSSVRQVSSDYLLELDRVERRKDDEIMRAVFEALGKTIMPAPFVADPGMTSVPEDVTEDLDLELQDRVYIRVNGKWYPAIVVDYRGDRMLDGTVGADGTAGNEHWKITGFMIDPEAPIPGEFLPPNGIFLKDSVLQEDRGKALESRRHVLKRTVQTFGRIDLSKVATVEAPARMAVSTEERYQKMDELLASERPMGEVIAGLQAIFPEANIRLDSDTLVADRTKMPDSQLFFAKILDYFQKYPELVEGKVIRILDFNLSNASTGSGNLLASSNLVTDEDLKGMDYDNQTLLQRQVFFERFGKRIAQSGILHVDHHYAGKLPSTTVMLVDYLLYLHQNGRTEEIRQIQENTFGLMDHFDTDILLANYVIQRAGDLEFLKNNENILKAVVRLNDFGTIPSRSKARRQTDIFFNVLQAIESKLLNAEMDLAGAYEMVDATLEFSKQMGQSYSSQALFAGIADGSILLSNVNTDVLALFQKGMAAYERQAVEFRKVFANGVIVNPKSMEAGNAYRMGSVLTIYSPDDAPQEYGLYALRYLQNEQPDALIGVGLIVLSSPEPGAAPIGTDKPRYLKMRRVPGATGDRIGDLRPIITSLNVVYPGTDGRQMAASLGFVPRVINTEAVVRQIVSGVAAAEGKRIVNQAVLSIMDLEKIPDEVALLNAEISQLRSKGSQYESQLKQVHAINLAVQYAWQTIGNPEIAYVVERYLRHDNVTDMQQTILKGGASMREEILKIKSIAEFENPNLATSWVENPNRRMRHDRDDALQIERDALGGSLFFSADEKALLKLGNPFKPEDDLMKRRKSESAAFNEYESVSPVINQAAQLEPALKLLLRYIAHQAQLSEQQAEISSRTKSQKSTVNKIKKFRSQSKGDDWAKHATVADIFDLLGGRIVVSDLAALEDLMARIDDIFGFKITVQDGKPAVDSSSQILRKENKFITDERQPLEKKDPYRAVQYTVRFPDAQALKALLTEAGRALGTPADELEGILRQAGQVSDPTLHTFELQIKTERGSTASDLFHDSVYKDLLQLLPELKQTVGSYNWNSLYEDIQIYRTKKLGYVEVDKDRETIFAAALAFVSELAGEASRMAETETAEAITQAILTSDANRFYDLVLSGYGANDVLPQTVRTLIKLFFQRQMDKLVAVKDQKPEWVEPLEAAAHDAYIESAVKDELAPKGGQLGWKLTPEAERVLESAPQAQAGLEAYRNRFNQFPVKGNKTSAEELQLHLLTNDELFAFFDASGKIFDSTAILNAIPALSSLAGDAKALKAGMKQAQLNGIEQVICQIILFRGDTDSAKKNRENLKVINLFHASREQQLAVARNPEDPDYIQNPEVRAKWLAQLDKNQLGTVISASMLTEMKYGAVRDFSGNLVVKNVDGKEQPRMRDLSEIVITTESGEVFTKREMMVFWIFVSAINEKNDFASRSYRDFVESPDSAWARKIDIAMDQSVLIALVRGQLDLLRDRIAAGGEVSPVLTARDQFMRGEVVEKYLRGILKDPVLVGHLSQHLQTKLLNQVFQLVAGGEASESLQSMIVQAAARPAEERDREARRLTGILIQSSDTPEQVRNAEALMMVFAMLDLTEKDVLDMSTPLVDRHAMLELNALKSLMQDADVVEAWAAASQQGYGANSRKEGERGYEPAPLYSPEELTQKFGLTQKMEALIANMAGFYALTSMVFRLKQKYPNLSYNDILDNVIADNLDSHDRNALMRRANMTWLATTLYKGISRMKRANFIPWDLLSNEEKYKDMVQIQEAARILREEVGGEADVDLQKKIIVDLMRNPDRVEPISNRLNDAYNANELRKNSAATVYPLYNPATAESSTKLPVAHQRVISNLGPAYAVLETTLSQRELESNPGMSVVSSLERTGLELQSPSPSSGLYDALHTAWMAGGPLTQVNWRARLVRDNLVPTEDLSEGELVKDGWVGIPAARGILYSLSEQMAAQAEYLPAKNIRNMSNYLPNMETPKAIRNALNRHGSAVIFGAPGSGKTELFDLAVLGKSVVHFDLRKEFIASLPEAEKEGAWSLYKTDAGLKEKELQWLRSNLSALRDKMLADGAEVALFDEFDLAIGSTLQGAENQTVQELLKLAEEVKRGGKKVALIVHDKALRTEGVLSGIDGQKSWFEAAGLLEHASQFVQTRFLTESEQSAILGFAGIRGRAGQRVAEAVEGLPTAYVDFLKQAAETLKDPQSAQAPPVDPQKMLKDTRVWVRQNYQVARKSATARTLSLLDDLASQTRAGNDPDVLISQQELLWTGLVTMSSGEIRMPALVREAIQEELASRATRPETEGSDPGSRMAEVTKVIKGASYTFVEGTTVTIKLMNIPAYTGTIQSLNENGFDLAFQGRKAYMHFSLLEAGAERIEMGVRKATVFVDGQDVTEPINKLRIMKDTLSQDKTKYGNTYSLAEEAISLLEMKAADGEYLYNKANRVSGLANIYNVIDLLAKNVYTPNRQNLNENADNMPEPERLAKILERILEEFKKADADESITGIVESAINNVRQATAAGTRMAEVTEGARLAGDEAAVLAEPMRIADFFRVSFQGKTMVVEISDLGRVAMSIANTPSGLQTGETLTSSEFRKLFVPATAAQSGILDAMGMRADMGIVTAARPGLEVLPTEIRAQVKMADTEIPVLVRLVGPAADQINALNPEQQKAFSAYLQQLLGGNIFADIAGTDADTAANAPANALEVIIGGMESSGLFVPGEGAAILKSGLLDPVTILALSNARRNAANMGVLNDMAGRGGMRRILRNPSAEVLSKMASFDPKYLFFLETNDLQPLDAADDFIAVYALAASAIVWAA